MDLSKWWAVVPVAGFGRRLRPHTYARPKPLLVVAGKPILGHILDQLVDVGVQRIVLVIGYMGDRITEYVDERGDFEVVESVYQRETLGLGHAVSLTRPVVGEDPMLIVYGDTVFQTDLRPALSDLPDAALGVKQVTDPSRFGVVVMEDGRVKRVVEKPAEFVSDQAIVGVNLVASSGHLFACLNTIMEGDQRTKGEFQLTDALQLMVEGGSHLTTFPVEEWYDCGTLEALLETNRHLLAGAALPQHATDTVIVPPVYIDPSASVRRSVIGPDVSIGEGARIDGVIARNAIIGAEAVVERILVEDSVIGYNAIVNGRPNRLNVGDFSEMTS